MAVKYFLRRYNISRSVLLYGEAGYVDIEDFNEEILEVCNKVEKYDPYRIYNEEESEFFIQLLPNITYLAPEELKIDAREVKAMRAKNILTFAIFMNADGSHIISPFFIGKCILPNAFSLSNDRSFL